MTELLVQPRMICCVLVSVGRVIQDRVSGCSDEM
jgi:hypothetical protein